MKKKTLTRSMMIALRGRRGLGEDDTSQDEAIAKMTPAQIVRERSGWELGDPSWAQAFADWMVQAGAKPQDF